MLDPNDYQWGETKVSDLSRTELEQALCNSIDRLGHVDQRCRHMVTYLGDALEELGMEAFQEEETDPIKLDLLHG